MRSAIGAAAARAARALTTMVLAPFYGAGWLVAAAVVAARHVVAAAATGWEDVMGSTAPRHTAPPKTPKPPAPAPERLYEPDVWWQRGLLLVGTVGILITMLGVGLTLWIVFIRLVANG